jgi:hypothetical protein
LLAVHTLNENKTITIVAKLPLGVKRYKATPKRLIKQEKNLTSYKAFIPQTTPTGKRLSAKTTYYIS